MDLLDQGWVRLMEVDACPRQLTRSKQRMEGCETRPMSNLPRTKYAMLASSGSRRMFPLKLHI